MTHDERHDMSGRWSAFVCYGFANNFCLLIHKLIFFGMCLWRRIDTSIMLCISVCLSIFPPIWHFYGWIRGSSNNTHKHHLPDINKISLLTAFLWQQQQQQKYPSKKGKHHPYPHTIFEYSANNIIRCPQSSQYYLIFCSNKTSLPGLKHTTCSMLSSLFVVYLWLFSINLLNDYMQYRWARVPKLYECFELVIVTF